MLPMAMTELSDVSLIQKKSGALRTTVPIGVRKHLKLVEGDKLAWDITPRGGKIVIEVRKV